MKFQGHLQDRDGELWSVEEILDYGNRCATPTFSEAEGAVADATELTLACATAGATIKYTTDGTLPSDTRGTTYSSAITLSTGDVTVTAIATYPGRQPSLLAQAVYNVS